MKATFTIEDTPQGIAPVLKWEGNGCCDNLHESLSMHLMADLAATVKRLDELKVLRVVDLQETQHRKI